MINLILATAEGLIILSAILFILVFIGGLQVL
jgi:hypothetical protein